MSILLILDLVLLLISLIEFVIEKLHKYFELLKYGGFPLNFSSSLFQKKAPDNLISRFFRSKKSRVLNLLGNLAHKYSIIH
ncbi:hypothetical protein APR42_16175 [Salegentibacter mishustinae]|uniref:Uncharacterized protein n=1 Tax=Salegentibacter mishustinae TaxID=270918 RepID=A0A0Q9Z974_9FLAO|nr:hypothetical protein APR42_16175 [Salegentibacter mishustinae]